MSSESVPTRLSWNLSSPVESEAMTMSTSATSVPSRLRVPLSYSDDSENFATPSSPLTPSTPATPSTPKRRHFRDFFRCPSSQIASNALASVHEAQEGDVIDIGPMKSETEGLSFVPSLDSTPSSRSIELRENGALPYEIVEQSLPGPVVGSSWSVPERWAVMGTGYLRAHSSRDGTGGNGGNTLQNGVGSAP